MAKVIENIYIAASEDYDLGSLDTFKRDMTNVETRRHVYDALKDDYDLGEWEQFSQTIDEDLGVDRQQFSVVPDFLTGDPNRKPTFQELQMQAFIRQAAQQNGTPSNEEATAIFHRVHNQLEQEQKEAQYKNGKDGQPKDSYIADYKIEKNYIYLHIKGKNTSDKIIIVDKFAKNPNITITLSLE